MELAERHDLYRDTLFRVKSTVHAALRGVRNFTTGRVRRWARAEDLMAASVIARSESPLWNASDDARNWILTAGKVQNLRVAARHLHGVEVPAGAVFSFWAQIGPPARRRGFVVGREIREGCLVPTVAGGLCQLSNALYDAALKAGFTIVERHRHSQVVPGSLAEQDRDATVKWNYVDLRFVAPEAFRIEVEITQEELRVAFRSRWSGTAPTALTAARTTSVLNDCFACGNTACHRHKGAKEQGIGKGITAFLVDERWPEYDAWIGEEARDGDLLLQPFAPGRPFRSPRYAWSLPSGVRTADAFVPAVRRGLGLRFGRSATGSLPPLLARHAERIARSMVRRIPVECTHVVVAQDLLPYVWREGPLGGRTFDVLMTRAPMERLHAQLDAAHALHPGSSTIADHRAPANLLALENTALTKARRIITPHGAIAAFFNNKSVQVPWAKPVVAAPSARGSKVLFPASALARKGAYELREAARALDLELVVAGRDLEQEGFWNGLRVERAGADPFAGVGLVVLPAHVEHRPRALLRALALGIPVIASDACGLPEGPGITVIKAGDATALREAIVAHRN